MNGYTLVFCPGGLVPQDDELPTFDTIEEAVAEGKAREYDSGEDCAFVLTVDPDGKIVVVYEFGVADDEKVYICSHCNRELRESAGDLIFFCNGYDEEDPGDHVVSCDDCVGLLLDGMQNCEVCRRENGDEDDEE